MSDQRLVIGLVGQTVGALEGVDLVGPVAALVGELRQERPGFHAHVVLHGRPQAPAHGVAGTPAGQLAGDGREQPKPFLRTVGIHQVAKGLLGEGEGLFGNLRDFGQRLQSAIGVAAAQLDLRQGLQQLCVSRVAGQALPQMLGRRGVVTLDHPQPALGEEDDGAWRSSPWRARGSGLPRRASAPWRGTRPPRGRCPPRGPSCPPCCRGPRA